MIGNVTSLKSSRKRELPFNGSYCGSPLIIALNPILDDSCVCGREQLTRELCCCGNTAYREMRHRESRIRGERDISLKAK